MTKSSKGPEHLSWISLILGVVLFGLAFFIGRWSGFTAVSAVAWQVLYASLIWFVLAIQFHLRALAEQERLDLLQLAKDGKGSTVFQDGAERAALMAVAQRRREVFEKWFLPAFAVLIAVYQLALGWVLLRFSLKDLDTQARQPLVAAIVMAAVAFVGFLISRYATGMSAQMEWKPLRAGGGSFLAGAVMCFLLAVGLAFAQFQVFWIEKAIAWVVPILLIVLGAETLINVVFDIYRPRLKGQYDRAAFDSRLLGIINEPGSLFHSAAGALDYQFGFKVSQTWFYKLLEKAIVPLILFGIATLYLISGVVVISPDQEAIIERLGRPVRDIGPGLSLKWPWPFEIARTYPTGRIMELYVGYVPKIDPKTGQPERGPLLWNKPHYKEEYSLLVASESTGVTSGGALPVSLVKANIPVHYRVKDLRAFLYNHSEPERLLEAICYQELTLFAASAKVETGDSPGLDPADLRESLLGAGRDKAKQVLTRSIQAAADRAGLGVEIVFLGFQGIHPPSEVAAEYEAVVGAVQERQAWVLNALAQRNQELSEVVGTVGGAYRLYELAGAYQKAGREGNRVARGELGPRLDAAFGRAGGEIFKTLSDAKAYAYKRARLAQATGLRFDGQVKAFRAAPGIYDRQQRLLAMEEALKGTRKYAVLSDPNDSEVLIVDLQEKLMPSLYDVGPLQEQTKP